MWVIRAVGLEQKTVSLGFAGTRGDALSDWFPGIGVRVWGAGEWVKSGW